jgi:Ca2+-dependent lipid-binding protein
MIRQCISSFAVHPMKYVVYNSNSELKNFNELSPVGMLKLTVVSAKQLKVADFLTSDPYVQIKFMDQTFKTKTVFKTLNPTWSPFISFLTYFSQE